MILCLQVHGMCKVFMDTAVQNKLLKWFYNRIDLLLSLVSILLFSFQDCFQAIAGAACQFCHL